MKGGRNARLYNAGMSELEELPKMYGGRIRVIVLGLIRRGGEILVFRAVDSTNGEVGYRMLGGGVEHGETSREALHREFREELGAELVDERFRAALENIFFYNGQKGHEIVFVYEAAFADQSLYEQDVLPAKEEDAGDFEALWMPAAEFKTGENILYTEGILDLI